jgi:hypothetical protein
VGISHLKTLRKWWLLATVISSLIPYASALPTLQQSHVRHTGLKNLFVIGFSTSQIRR